LNLIDARLGRLKSRHRERRERVQEGVSVKSESIATMETRFNDTHQSVVDMKLVNRALTGDSEACATLFNTHNRMIYAICLRMTNNNIAQAEDLTQDAFLQVFRKLSTFQGNSALSTWLHRIAVNTVLMHFRKKVLKQVSLDEVLSQTSRAVGREYGTRDHRLEESVDRITLAQAIADLPDGYKAIFLLHDVEGYEHREIARMLDCSIGNSKSQLHKARLRIRDSL
jgi:RNA polymerase sigma-70 factor (ECF subfamily)